MAHQYHSLLGDDEELKKLLKKAGLRNNGLEDEQNPPNVRCLIQLIRDLRCREGSNGVGGEYGSDRGISKTSFNLLPAPEQLAYLQGMQDATCCAFALRSPGGMGAAEQLLNYRTPFGTRAIKAHAHLLLLLALSVSEDGATLNQVADLCEPRMKEQYAIEQHRKRGLEKMTEQRLKVSTDSLTSSGQSNMSRDLSISPNVSPALAKARTQNVLLPPALQKPVAMGAGTLKTKGRRVTTKKVVTDRPDAASLWYNFNQKESTEHKGLTEHEENSCLEKMKFLSRGFHAALLYRSPEDYADLMGNHNSCMRAVSRSKSSGGLRALPPDDMASMGTILGATKSEKEICKQAQQLRELTWRLVPDLKKSKKEEQKQEAAKGLAAFLGASVGGGARTHHSADKPSPLGKLEEVIDEISIFAEQNFNADCTRFFHALDSNASGSIALNEFIVSLTTLHFINDAVRGRQQEDVKQLFKFLDHNHGGSISLKEFRNIFGERLQARARAAQEGEADALPSLVEIVHLLADTYKGDLPRAFEAIDTDGSGRLKENEWIAGLKGNKYINEKVPGRGEMDCIEVFHMIDDNGGGSISLREFQAFFGPRLIERRKRLGLEEGPVMATDLVDDLKAQARRSFIMSRPVEFVGAQVSLHEGAW